MIKHQVGDMLKQATTGFLVHGCNCQGVMGSGIAWSIRHNWPPVFKAYRTTQAMSGLELGTIVPVQVEPNLVVVNAMTQRYFSGHPQDPDAKRYVDYEAIAKSFETINDELPGKYPGVDLVLNFPLIGADRGRGDWNIISNIIDHTVTNFDKVLWTLE